MIDFLIFIELECYLIITGGKNTKIVINPQS